MKPYFRCNYADFPSDACDGVCVPLTQGRHTIVDADDFINIVGEHYWCAKGKGGVMYACRRTFRSPTETRLHRLIANADMPQVDHINGNTLDNRKANLRACTHAQNQWNQKPRSGRKYKGVTYKKETGKWVAQISKLRISLGSYETPEAAAMAYDAKAREIYGEFAWLNFPIAAGVIRGV